jgi:hypothetical protein
MNGFQLMRRLRAFGEGRPIPCGKTKHLEVVPGSQALLLAFLRMGGETAPWGVGWKYPGRPAKIATVPEPRDRELVAQMLAGEFTDDLASHLLHPAVVRSTYDKDNLPPLQQVWLPGPSHLEMLHLIAMAYAFVKKGAPDRVRKLQVLGRSANFLFLQGQRPGQQMVVDATQLLRQAYAFPADDLRQAHLGFLLAWLRTAGDVTVRVDAAAKAETMPVSTALSPAVDRDRLAPNVEAYNKATEGRGEDGRWKRQPENEFAKVARAKVDEVLREELERRLQLVEQARKHYSEDRRVGNPGLRTLIDATRHQHLDDYLKPNQNEKENRTAYHPSAITDRSPKGAAIRYLEMEADESRRVEALSAADEDLVDEILGGGEGFVGTIQSVVDDTEGQRRVTPVWYVRSQGLPPLRLKAGDEVRLQEFPKRIGSIRAIDADLNGRTFEVEITGAKLKPKNQPSLLDAADPKLVGRKVTFLTLPNAYFSRERTNKVKFGVGPGDWLLKDLGQPEDTTATENEP